MGGKLYELAQPTIEENMMKEFTSLKITEQTIGIAAPNELGEDILGHQNIIAACRRIISNKGSHDINVMSAKELIPNSNIHHNILRFLPY